MPEILRLPLAPFFACPDCRCLYEYGECTHGALDDCDACPVFWDRIPDARYWTDVLPIGEGEGLQCTFCSAYASTLVLPVVDPHLSFERDHPGHLWILIPINYGPTFAHLESADRLSVLVESLEVLAPADNGSVRYVPQDDGTDAHWECVDEHGQGFWLFGGAHDVAITRLLEALC